ncbi:E3 ubiquitin-protein ligase MIB2 isoform X4 [Octopus sinensis]|uniref:E3 ubiquitin-protein ligase MIB2 isoform X4 n=1 Tax=Octopus sinensis TaxID=2607531 RepID=A0A7E6EJM9_9MOLL|nr:E3 ubiquitin-protein ligase MIB2 isoform X4 [Octopus sinensis]
MSSLSSLQINKPIDGLGRTPLIFACEEGADRRIIDILIKAGAKLGAKDYGGQTALHLAVYRRRLQAVELLLSRGSNVNEKSSDGSTSLHLAVSSSQEWIDGVKELLKHSAVKMNPRDEYGQTPLHRACWRGYLHTVDILLGHNGIDANVVDNDGDTPLHEAVRNTFRRKYKVVCAMLKQGSVQLDIQNNHKRTPLLEAVSQSHLGMTHLLIALGADINAVDGEGNSCLHLAMATEKFNSEGAPLDLLNECCTSLNLKIEERLSGIVVARYLASQGADFHHKNNKNNTPLDLIKDPNLRKKLEAFLPPQCLLCRNKSATTKVHPCGHLVICKGCSNVTLQRCLKCGKPVTSRTGDEAPKFEDRCVKKEATCQELGAASQAIEAPKFEDRCVKKEATCQELGAASQAIESPKSEDKCVQTEVASEEIESVNLDEKLLHSVAKKLGNKWQQLGE